MSYQEVTDRMLTLIEESERIARGDINPADLAATAATTEDIKNEFFYLLGSLPRKEQDSFLGLIVATDMIQFEYVKHWLTYRKVLDEGADPHAAEMHVKNLADNYSTMQKAFLNGTAAAMAQKKSSVGECPPEDLVNRRMGETCTQDADCCECWKQSALKYIRGEYP